MSTTARLSVFFYLNGMLLTGFCLGAAGERQTLAPFPDTVDADALTTFADSLADVTLSPGDEERLQGVIERCRDLGEHPPIAAYRIVSLAYWHLGESEASRRFFVQYVGLAAKTAMPEDSAEDGGAGRKNAARLFLKEIRRLYSANDHKEVVVYADEALARYHDMNEIWMGQRLAAKSCQAERQFSDAVARLWAATRGASDTVLAANFFREVVIMTLRAGQADLTLAIIAEDGPRFDTADMLAFSMYHKGLAHTLDGARSYPKAVGEFSRLIKQYPKSQFVGMASIKKAEITRSVLDALSSE